MQRSSTRWSIELPRLLEKIEALLHADKKP